ncbi:MAG: amino acid permease [Gammaproteobacteria bacterium]|nr:amino acid permease [Gammaproteobacteria bacterium]
MDNLSKRLESRHVNMIALGGAIGTGIFLTSGYSIAIGGPGGALFAYMIMSVIVYFLMTSLGEMSTYRPTAGTFCEYSNQYVGRSFGFAMGYNYWLNWAITLATEVSAASIIMSYWFPVADATLFSVIFFALIFLFNIFSVRVYGEMEFWLSFMKVAVILLFIVLGVYTVVKQPHFGLPNWHIGDAHFHKGWMGFIMVFLFAGFSFQGTELVGVASGETKNPEVNLPKSIKRVFWRLTLFYIVSIGIISLLIPYTDPRLMSQTVSTSPYTLIFEQYLSHYAGGFINLVILIAVLSAGNASMYSSTRILWYLGKTGQAPAFFTRITSYGLPICALIATALIGSLVFISSYIGNGVLFTYLVQISSLSGFIAWFGIALSHYFFRKKFLPELGGVEILKYRAKFYPYAQIISMIVIAIVILAQFVTMFGQSAHWLDYIAIYSSLILFALFYIGHKVFAKKTFSR